MKITITNKFIAQDIMSNPDIYKGITHIVSIGANHPIQTVPNGFDTHPAKKLRLEFFDISSEERDGMNGPSKQDITKLIEFFKEILQSDEPNVLVHCYAGKSRSVAAGLILLNMYYNSKEKAWEDLIKTNPEPTPNQRMLKLSEEIL